MERQIDGEPTIEPPVMSPTAKALTVAFGGLTIFAVTVIVGAIVVVFTTPLDTSANDIGAGPGSLVMHLFLYGFKGAVIGGIIGGLLWALLGFLVYRKWTKPSTDDSSSID